MEAYLQQGVLTQQVAEGFVLVERTTAAGSRLGLVCAVDLETYSFDRGTDALVRPTEETIVSRIPARMAIRKEAALETSHVMLLMDDTAQTVIEPVYAQRENLSLLYDAELMLGGGHIRGWAVTEDALLQRVCDALTELRRRVSMLFAVGDGNHSLATAKACWEEIKPALSAEEIALHPARYAMVELVNIHDPALLFEPIHRILKGVEPQSVMEDWADYCHARFMDLNPETPGLGCCHAMQVMIQGEAQDIRIENPDGRLEADTLQRFLEDYVTRHPGVEIDYIHGADAVAELTKAPDVMGFMLPGLVKETFFHQVEIEGVMPRKTFSMGEAWEKRYYMECRRIR